MAARNRDSTGKVKRAKGRDRKTVPVSADVTELKRGKSVKNKSRAGSPIPRKSSQTVCADGQVEPYLPVVGIGASAGGLEAFKSLLANLPRDTGMAFVFVQHLDPRYKSNLAEIFSKCTQMTVCEVQDGMSLQADHIYIMPADRDIAVFHRALTLMKRPEGRRPHTPIDYFFRSLAEDLRDQAIGVVLSGTGSDGTLGVKAIRAAGGITIAQDEKSAAYEGMPLSASSSGAVDVVLAPPEIAQELARIGQHPHVNRPKQALLAVDRTAEGDPMQKIFVMLRDETGVDFAHYKQNTVQRRISRRMVLHKLEKVEQYVRYLQQSPGEIRALHEDMLINVTGFFREPEMFDGLKEEIFPQILKNRSRKSPVRVWIPGCSTGEEAYSMAICLLEYMEHENTQFLAQIFATDISQRAIEAARAGIYPANIVADVTPERISRFFLGCDHGYQVNKTIRDMCIFAIQNVTKDPPFSKIDLIICRNLLIYLGPILQERVIPILHYALKPAGYLVLGSSESIGKFSDLFRLANRKRKIYGKKSGASRLPVGFYSSGLAAPMESVPERPHPRHAGGEVLLREADRIVLEKYGPAGVVVDEQMNILQFRGKTGLYLEPAPGEAGLNLMKMARPGLPLGLRVAINTARKQGTPVRSEGLTIKQNGGILEINLEVIPMGQPESRDGALLVLFEKAQPSPPKTEAGEAETKDRGKKATLVRATARTQQAMEKELQQLRREVESSRQSLQAIAEEHEATVEDLRAANEEIQSSNEELQSTNEELQTAKEELESANEELTTVNDELEGRNIDLGGALDDLNNIFTSVNVPIVMLGLDLRIRSATPLAQKVLNVRGTDVGRPITELKLGIEAPNLEDELTEVMHILSPVDREVSSADRNSFYRMQIRPYRTSENKIDGAVLVVTDITEQRRIRQLAEAERDYAQSIVKTIRQPFIVLDSHLKIISANPAFYRSFKVSRQETEGEFIYDLGNGQWDIPQLRTLLEEIIPKHKRMEGYQVTHDFPDIGHRVMQLNAHRIEAKGERPELILLAIEEGSHGQAE